MKVHKKILNQKRKKINQNNRINIQNKDNVPLGETVKNVEFNKIKTNKRSNFLNLIIVFMISFIALILILDTFVEPLIKIFPDLETFLYNLYESINDISLFIKDLT